MIPVYLGSLLLTMFENKVYGNNLTLEWMIVHDIVNNVTKYDLNVFSNTPIFY